jgi:hypothetical protein
MPIKSRVGSKGGEISILEIKVFNSYIPQIFKSYTDSGFDFKGFVCSSTLSQ